MSGIRAQAGLFWLLPILTGGPAQAQTADSPEPLEIAVTLDRELAARQSHGFLVMLKSGEYARVRVYQHSINVVVAVAAPDGANVLAVNDSTSGGESAEWVAGEAGAYVVRIGPAGPSPSPGRYAITLEDVEQATERLRLQVEAARAFSRGMALWGEQTTQGQLKAAGNFQEALTHARAARDQSREANALLQLSLLYADTGDKQKALDFAAQALPVARAARDLRAEGWALNAAGHAHNTFGDRRKAVEFFNQALPVMRAAADRDGEGAVYNNLATAHSWLGDKHRALEYLELGIRIYGDIQDRRKLSILFNNKGVIHGELGEYQRALEQYQASLDLRREMSDRRGEGISLNNMGSAYSSLAEYQKALDSYSAALEIHRSLNRPWDAAINLHNIAWVYGSLGDRPRALEYYRQAEAILREVKDESSLGNTLNNLGELYAAGGDHRKALETYSEALTHRRAAGHADGEASTLSNMGVSFAKLGQRDPAREHFEQAIAILRKSGDRRRLAVALRRFGALHREEPDQQPALDCLDEALAIARSIRDRRGEAETLAELARVYRDRGDAAAAQRRAESALSLFESLRLTMASPALRASFFAAARDTQELDIEQLLRLHRERPGQGFDAAALLAAERGRARSLLELLVESGVELRTGAGIALLDRERELERLIAGKAEQRTRLLSRKRDDPAASAIARDLDALAAELDRVQGRIRDSSPRYGALTRPSPLGLREIQTTVLDEGTVLLEYALGSARGYLWAVTPSSVDVFELPRRAEIESAVKRVYDLLTARNHKPPGETPAARAARILQADRAFPAAAREVSRILLAPAAPRLGRQRLLIAGEGILNYLPFAALPDPAAGGTKPVPLMVNHEIVTAPSASVLAVLRSEAAAREPARKMLAVLADPVFNASDSRVARRDEPSASRLRAGYDLDGTRFVRLRFTRTEAEAIARLAPPEATLKALDFDASRETVLRPDFGQYRIVHFATHSLLDNQRPELSGVVLSLVDRSGQRQNGFLRLYDVYNLKLGAELVVLSACQTALGDEVKGEGLIGLTRGFFYAGASRVVASLWETDDRTPAELMKRFYESLLARGESPAAALRSTQLAAWKMAGWEEPYFWASFILQGEWRQMRGRGRPAGNGR